MLEENLKELRNYQSWQNIVMKGYNITLDQFNLAFDEFETKCLVSCEDKTIGGLKRYFSSWLPYHKERIFKINKHEQRQANNDQLDQLTRAAIDQLNGSANPER
jgi:hypothetical protein